MEKDLMISGFFNNKFPKISFEKLFFKSKKITHPSLSVPSFIHKCEGIQLAEKKVKSILFSTDMAMVENSNADAVLAVYPFSPSLAIMKSLIDFSQKPVICGIGGGITKGKKAIEMAKKAEDLGACAVIVNQPFPVQDIKKLKANIQIPVISSVSHFNFDFGTRVNAGIDYFQITAGTNSQKIIEDLKFKIPGFPVIATGGSQLTEIQKTIEAGAKAIVLTPPSSKELFKSIMDTYRKGINHLK